MTRHLIVVDVETTGLGDDAFPLEVAAINVNTGEELYFVPFIYASDLAQADPIAMEINQYHERGIAKNMLSILQTASKYVELTCMLQGNTFAGSNPRFDSELLKRQGVRPEWHHRLADLANYAARELGRSATNLPGLVDVCEHFKIINEGPHQAMYDVYATAKCFIKLGGI